MEVVRWRGLKLWTFFVFYKLKEFLSIIYCTQVIYFEYTMYVKQINIDVCLHIRYVLWYKILVSTTLVQVKSGADIAIILWYFKHLFY